jgi:hypothetical protein
MNPTTILCTCVASTNQTVQSNVDHTVESQPPVSVSRLRLLPLPLIARVKRASGDIGAFELVDMLESTPLTGVLLGGGGERRGLVGEVRMLGSCLVGTRGERESLGGEEREE